MEAVGQKFNFTPMTRGERFKRDLVQTRKDLRSERANYDRPIDASRHHVCFGVTDIDAAMRDLDAAGVAYRRGEQHQRERVVVQVFFTDPCGNTIELQEDRD